VIISLHCIFHQIQFIREKILSGIIKTSSVSSNDKFDDIFTTSLWGPQIDYICNKLDADDIYSLRGSVDYSLLFSLVCQLEPHSEVQVNHYVIQLG
jgi:hypothetical protein